MTLSLIDGACNTVQWSRLISPPSTSQFQQQLHFRSICYAEKVKLLLKLRSGGGEIAYTKCSKNAMRITVLHCAMSSNSTAAVLSSAALLLVLFPKHASPVENVANSWAAHNNPTDARQIALKNTQTK